MDTLPLHPWFSDRVAEENARDRFSLFQRLNLFLRDAWVLCAKRHIELQSRLRVQLFVLGTEKINPMVANLGIDITSEDCALQK